jgi:hypothetical protein
MDAGDPARTEVNVVNILSYSTDIGRVNIRYRRSPGANSRYHRAMTEPSPFAPAQPEPAQPVPAAGPVPYRVATIVTLSVASALLLFFFVGNRVTFGGDYSGTDYTTPIYLGTLALAIVCFVVALVLRSRTKRLGLPLRLATAAVAVSSVLLGIVVVAALLLLAAFVLLVATFVGG